MRSLYLRIWITVVAALALFALVSGWLVQRHLGQERAHAEAVLSERVAAWGELMQRALPPADAPAAAQTQALRAWSHRLRVPMALDDAAGRRIATTEAFARREPARPGQEFGRRDRGADDDADDGVDRRGKRAEGDGNGARGDGAAAAPASPAEPRRPGRALPIRFDDGRTLWLMPPRLWGDHPMARAMWPDAAGDRAPPWPPAAGGAAAP
ncbi:MAG: hypothetical protein HYZ20_19990, partial [Burkholderiales bacterium]|nr:hypothetical protein [Burkholderiales bacterium]